mgnify:CR=1 FL=1
MVMRSIEVKEISYKVEKKRIKQVILELKRLYGSCIKIKIEDEEIKVSGDLRNYKMRERIIWVLSGGKHGTDVSAS